MDQQTLSLHPLSLWLGRLHLLASDQFRRLTKQQQQIAERPRLVPDIKEERTSCQSGDENQPNRKRLTRIGDSGRSPASRDHKDHLTMCDGQIEMVLERRHEAGLSTLHDADGADALCRLPTRPLDQCFQGHS